MLWSQRFVRTIILYESSCFSVVFPNFHCLKIVRMAFVAVCNGICDRGFFLLSSSSSLYLYLFSLCLTVIKREPSIIELLNVNCTLLSNTLTLYSTICLHEHTINKTCNPLLKSCTVDSLVEQHYKRKPNFFFDHLGRRRHRYLDSLIPIRQGPIINHNRTCYDQNVSDWVDLYLNYLPRPWTIQHTLQNKLKIMFCSHVLCFAYTQVHPRVSIDMPL